MTSRTATAPTPFPSQFTFGVATSAFQIEGGADQRLPCIWDTFCRQPGKIRDGSNGDVACDHMGRLEADLDLIAWMGVDAYRFSINWARFIDENGAVDSRGLDFYERVVDGLARRDIEAFVTLYHWELPAHLEAQGGWLNRETADRFADYTAHAVRYLGDRVTSWATLNEPWCSAWLGYGNGIHAPGLIGLDRYRQAAHHLLLAHGQAMEVLQREAGAALKGIVLNVSPCEPASDTAADRAAARLADDFHYQWFLRPLLEGRYPDLVDTLPDNERPPVRPGDLALIATSLDYLGLNYYTRQRYRAGGEGGFESVPPGGDTTAMGWEVHPQGLEDVLRTLDGRYDLPPLYICENGIALDDTMIDGQIKDSRRAAFLDDHLEALVRAMNAGVDVRGYFHWSLMDNFEWAEGYAKRFGLVWVDYDTLERTPKASAHAYRARLLGRSGGADPAGDEAVSVSVSGTRSGRHPDRAGAG